MYRSQRSDFLILVLTDCVLPDFGRAENRIRLGFEQRRLDKAEQDLQKLANAIDLEIAQEMVSIDPHGYVCVLSSSPRHLYDSDVLFSLIDQRHFLQKP